MAINVLQSELAVIKGSGDRYVITERGEDVLESQDPSDLADWILARILGADKAITFRAADWSSFRAARAEGGT